MTTERELREREWRRQSASSWSRVGLKRGNMWPKLIIGGIFVLSFLLAARSYYNLDYLPKTPESGEVEVNSV